MKTKSLSHRDLYQLAKRIKPIVHLHKMGNTQYVLKVGPIGRGDMTVFVDSYPLFESYYYGFDLDRALKAGEKPFSLLDFSLVKVGEFTCYHHSGGKNMFPRPTAAEVLQQLPDDVDTDKICAFEITFPSLNPGEIYDEVLDCHVSTVVLYSMKNGLPELVQKQPVYLTKDDVGYPSVYE